MFDGTALLVRRTSPKNYDAFLFGSIANEFWTSITLSPFLEPRIDLIMVIAPDLPPITLECLAHSNVRGIPCGSNHNIGGCMGTGHC